tara:strand:- start:1055 stop:1549 length:495 start_codon:yes stop_codon:yes gene_type:complete
MKDELKYIFGNVNEWLKFAEAKHAGIIVLNSAIIIGVLSSNNLPFEKWSIIISLVSISISILASLISQFPITSNFLVRYKHIEKPNIYFFGDLAKIKMADFIVEFQNSFPEFNPNQSDKNIINQILINSKITLTKYKIFKFCCWLSVFGIGLLGISTLITNLCR